MSGNRLPVSQLVRLAVVEQVFSVLRHDVRNKLASVRNAAFYLRRKYERAPGWIDDPKNATFFDLIATELGCADSLLEGRVCLDVSSFAERSAATAAPGIARALDDLRCDLDAGKIGLEVEIAAGARAPSEDGLALVVRLLGENAIEAMPEGGTLRIEYRETVDRMVLDVLDSGPGIADPALASEPFHTTKAGHLGLGLPIVDRVARRLGGRLEWVAEERGAHARVIFPLDAE